MIFLSLLSEVIERTLVVTLTNSNNMMVCYIMIDYYMYYKGLRNFKFFKPDMTHWLLAILDSTRFMSWCLVTIGGHNFRSS